MVLSTQADKLGSFYFQSDTHQVDKVSADVIPPGKLLFYDSASTKKYKQTVNGTEFGPWEVSVIDTAPAGALKVHTAAPGSYVIMECQGALNPNCEVGPGTRPGTIAEYVEPTVSAAYAQAEVTAVRNARRKLVGKYHGKTNNNTRDGGVCPAAVDTDLVIIEIYKSS